MSKFKVGDRVQLIGYTGYAGVILELSNNNDDDEIARVLFDHGGEYSYYTKYFELIGGTKVASKFGVGDHVQLIDNPKYTGIILGLSNNGEIARISMGLLGEGRYYNKDIELIGDAKVTPKFEVGNKVWCPDRPEVNGKITEISSSGKPVATIVDSNMYRRYAYLTDIVLVEEPKTEQIKPYEKTKEYEYYKYSYKGVKLDPYRILSIYKITCPAQQHAIKKLLRAGNSIKELKEDITEVIDTLKRKLEMLEEDSDNP